MKRFFIALAALMMMGSAHATSVSYIDENGKEQTITSGFELVSDQISHWSLTMQKIIVVGKDNNNDGTINAADATLGQTTFNFTNGLTISNNVTFIICDGFTLNLQAPTATATEQFNALELSDNAKLTFFGQKNGAGTVVMSAATQGTKVELEETVLCGQNSSLTFNGVMATIFGPVDTSDFGYYGVCMYNGAVMTINSGSVNVLVSSESSSNVSSAINFNGSSSNPAILKINDGVVDLKGGCGAPACFLGTGNIEVAGGTAYFQGDGGATWKSFNPISGGLMVTAKGMKISAGSSFSSLSPVANDANLMNNIKTQACVKMEIPTFNTRVLVNEKDTKVLESGMYTCPSLSDGAGAALAIRSGATVTGEAVTFKNNKITGVANYGGAVYCNRASLTLKDFAFINNSAKHASALYVGEDESSTQLTDGVFKGNSSIDEGTASLEGAVTLKNVQFIDNTCSGNSGNYAILQLRGSFDASSLTNLKFENNSSGRCGALLVKAGSTTADSLEFIGNSATEQGGAIYLERDMTLNHAIFNKNTANEGGAIYNRKTLTLKKAVFNGNSAKSGMGGAIYNTGIINLQDSVVLGGKTDSIYNYKNSEIKWDLTGQNTGKLFGYEKLDNDGGKLSLTVNKDIEIGEYPIALGDLTDVTGKNDFTLKTAKDKTGKTISIDGKKVCYSNRLYSLFKKIEAPTAKQRLSEDSQNRKQFKIHEDTLILKVEPGICRIRETFYETLDSALKVVQKGDTIVLLADVEMEHSLELPAGTFLNLDGFSLKNPTGLDLRWDLTGNKAPVVLDFDKLAADGTLTLSLPDKKLFGEIVLAEDAAQSTDKEFVLTGAPTFDGKDRKVAVGGDRVFYGHRFYSLSLNNDDQIVLKVERVIAPANEVWAVSTDGNQLALSSTDGYNACPEKTELVAEDALTRFVFGSEVTRIGRFGLEGNTALKEVYLSENIETVQPYAFRNCSNLEFVSMGTKVEEINENAFDGCEKLNDINLEAGLKEIDAFAFRNCKSLVEVMLPKTIEYVGSRSFWGCEAMEAIFILGTEPEKINMTHESFKGMKEHTPIFVTRNKLILFEAYNYGKGINFQTMGIASLDADQTGMGFFCHHNMIVPQGATAYGVTWNGTSFEKGESAGEGEVLEGGKGYLFTGAPDVYIIETTSKPATKSIESDLTGTMEDVTVGELKKLGKVYYAEEYKGGLMYRLTEPTDILTPGEAFAIITDNGAPSVKYFDFDNWYNGWTTGVQTPSEVRSEELGVRSYNLAGQAVGSDYKGIVIKNGKKYLNK